jgi:protein-disulfide isomerase
LTPAPPSIIERKKDQISLVSLVFFQAQATTTKRSAAMDRLFYLAMMGLMMTLFTGCTMAGSSSSPPLVATGDQGDATAAAVLEPTAAAPTVPMQSSSSQTTTTDATMPVLVATAVPTATAATESTNWLATVTVDGTSYILGNPNAPIRLVDYSDFL